MAKPEIELTGEARSEYVKAKLDSLAVLAAVQYSIMAGSFRKAAKQLNSLSLALENLADLLGDLEELDESVEREAMENDKNS